MSNYYIGQRLDSNYNGKTIEIVSVGPGRQVMVSIDGQQQDTTSSYLDGTFHEPGTRRTVI